MKKINNTLSSSLNSKYYFFKKNCYATKYTNMVGERNPIWPKIKRWWVGL